MVWSHIQQRYDFFSQSPLLMIDLSLVVRDFGFTLDEVNWLGNIIACVYLPTAVLTPIITKRYGLKRCVCSVSFHVVSSHLAWTVFYCFCPCLVISLDPLCRNFAVAFQRRRLLFHHYWPGEGKNPKTPSLLMLSSGTVRHFATSIPDFGP
jgi:hypothetical protein